MMTAWRESRGAKVSTAPRERNDVKRLQHTEKEGDDHLLALWNPTHRGRQ